MLPSGDLEASFLPSGDVAALSSRGESASFGGERSFGDLTVLHRVTSLIRNRHTVGPYRRTTPRALWGC